MTTPNDPVQVEPLSLRTALADFIADDRLLTDAVQAISAWHDAMIAARQPASPDPLRAGDVARALHWWAGHTHDEACTCHDRAVEFLPHLRAALGETPHE